MNKYTIDLVDLVVKIARTAAENQKEYFIGGGFAIDLSLGRITRDHHDIDFHPMLEDSIWWSEWFEDQGYEVIEKADPKFTEVFKVKDQSGKAVVDMWPFKLDKGRLLIKHEDEYADSKRHWKETRTVFYKSTPFKIENPERVLEQKLRHAKRGQKLRPQDLHDLKRLGKESN